MGEEFKLPLSCLPTVAGFVTSMKSDTLYAWDIMKQVLAFIVNRACSQFSVD